MSPAINLWQSFLASHSCALYSLSTMWRTPPKPCSIHAKYGAEEADSIFCFTQAGIKMFSSIKIK